MGVIGLLMIAAGICFVAQAYKAQLSMAFKRRLKSVSGGSARDSLVNNASDASFPASDPPSWTAAVGKPAAAEGKL